MKEYLRKILEGKDLGIGEAEAAMDLIMTGKASDAQIGAFLAALRMKGESVDEITAFAKVLRRFATKVKPKVKATLVDTCGTGGDLADTFNISTAAAFVAAGAGVLVAKHGNRSVSSKSGSADVLEALGVKIDLGPAGVERCIEEVGIGFMFAPRFHSAMKYAIGPRREMGVRTVFNILGPLISPAEVKAQVFGVYDPELTEKLAQVLDKLGCSHAMVVHGSPGLDEFSTLGETRVSELAMGEVKTYTVKPEDFGIKRSRAKDLAGGTPEENAKMIMAILGGEKGPKRDIVVLNAAAALLVGGVAQNFEDGIRLAEESIDSGKASGRLDRFARFSHELD